MKNLIRKFQQWCIHWADTRWGVWALVICAFSDASVFGLPTPVLFVTLVLLNRAKAYKYALYGLSGTLAGALTGYFIGHFAWIDSSGGYTGLAKFLFNNIPGFSIEVYDKIHSLYSLWDFWILFAAAAFPLPFKIFSISSGVFDINLIIFCSATLVSQGMKFFLLAFLTTKAGPRIKRIFELNWKPIVLIVTASIAVTIVILKLF